MRPRTPPHLTFWAVVAALALLSACVGGRTEPPAAAPAEPSPRPSPQTEGGGPATGTLRYGVAAPDDIVPPDAAAPSELVLVDAMFDPLTRWTPELDVEAAAAVRWGSDDEARTWTFELRRGATFHDGSPVTAADVKFAWELAVTEDLVGYHLRDVVGYEALRAGEADELVGVEADGERTLRVRLDRPDAEFPSVVAHPSLAPVPQEAWEADPEGFRERPVGNGPFEAAEAIVPDSFLRTARFDGWRNGTEPVGLSEVLFQFMDPETAYVAFQQGRLDFTTVPPDALDDALARYERSVDGYRGPGVIVGEVPVVYYLGFNLSEEPYDHVELRRGVSLAIDRTRLVADVFEDNAAVARGIVPPVLPDARASACRSCRYDPDEAAAIFDELGVDELTLWVNREGAHAKVARRVRADLAEVGVRLVLRTEEFPAFLDRLADGEAGLFRFGWALDYPTMRNALEPLFHSEASPDAGGYNYGGYRAVDELLEAARATLDPVERRSRYREAEDLILNRDQVVVPLAVMRHRAVASERLEGLVHTPMGTTNFHEIHLAEEE